MVGFFNLLFLLVYYLSAYCCDNSYSDCLNKKIRKKTNNINNFPHKKCNSITLLRKLFTFGTFFCFFSSLVNSVSVVIIYIRFTNIIICCSVYFEKRNQTKQGTCHHLKELHFYTFFRPES